MFDSIIRSTSRGRFVKVVLNVCALITREGNNQKKKKTVKSTLAQLSTSKLGGAATTC